MRKTKGTVQRPPENKTYSNRGKYITSPHDPAIESSQADDARAFKQLLKTNRGVTRDLRKWISRRWGRMGDSATYTHPQLKVNIRFTQEKFDCGFEVLTVSSLDIQEERGAV